MKAIMTKYLPATEHRPARVKAWDMDGNSITIIPQDGPVTNHTKAAYALRDKMKWQGELIGGGIKGGMVFVFAEKDNQP